MKTALGAASLAVTVLAACASEPAAPAQPELALAPPPAPDVDFDVDDANETVDPQATAEQVDEPEVDERQPLGRYVSTRTVSIRGEPNRDADSVGTLARNAPFDVYAWVDGPRCRKGLEGKWAELERGGFVCLKHATATTQDLGVVPKLEGDEIVPYIYARPRRKDGAVPEQLPQWRSKKALLAGDDPESMRPGYGTFAFRSRKFSKKFKALYYSASRRVMLGEDLRLLKPSQFEGRDLRAEPLGPKEGLGWVISREASVLAEPKDDGAPLAPLDYHQSVEVVGVKKTAGNYVSVRVRTDAGTVEGYLHDSMVARWIPPQRVDGVADDELWVAVEINEQTLTLMRGSTPTFATVVSTGRFADPTPTGDFRIELKKALGTMRSLPDADEPYAVEGVPWAAYFQGRYALHGAYWHDRFGRRNSHGCVNLSPKDAKRVFEALTPAMPGGWVTVRTGQDEVGTLVSIRKAP